ncbi:MAG: trehalose-phosphatase [Candidatus Omnitrophica bacterium]|nr:trehalose-phosphatase [Candidatus Omnitrophota bacterium]
MDCGQNLKNFFENLDEIKARLDGKTLVVFLDYDGTLTPIVSTPDLAIISDEMRNVVESLSKKVKVAIVSGRATDDVRSKVKISGIFYAGSHGFEINDPQGEVKINEEAQKIRPVIDEVQAKLAERVKNIEGALIENVKYTVSCHYRLVKDEDFEVFENQVDSVLSEYPQLRKTSGKKVFEIRPKIDWHKGKAVDWILSVFEKEQKNILPVYLGDDTTDEDAFRALKEKGFGVLVSTELRDTQAEYIVRDSGDVKKVLQTFIDLS